LLFVNWGRSAYWMPHA